jgi:TetR/AcrR family transcriptional regulator, transcriptional repressor for nem operon
MDTLVSELSAHRGPGRPREFDGDEALDRAILVFSAHGYSATSITDLTSALNLTAGSIYKAFKDKRGLFDAALERYLKLRTSCLEDKLRSAETGRERVEAILINYAENSYGEAGRRGCLIVGSAIELASSDHAMAKRITQVFKAHKKRLVQIISEGQKDGSISTGTDPATLAQLLLCITQGMRVLGKTGRTRAEMVASAKAALRLLD